MNLMRFFGFEGDEDEYDDDYSPDERPTRSTTGSRNTTRRRRERDEDARNVSGSNTSEPGVILYKVKGAVPDQDKRRLREAFNKGALLVLDLHELTRQEYEEEGARFITFMGGLAFARGGEVKLIEPSQYLITPREGMLTIWPEEEERE